MNYVRNLMTNVSEAIKKMLKIFFYQSASDFVCKSEVSALWQSL